MPINEKGKIEQWLVLILALTTLLIVIGYCYASYESISSGTCDFESIITNETECKAAADDLGITYSWGGSGCGFGNEHSCPYGCVFMSMMSSLTLNTNATSPAACGGMYQCICCNGSCSGGSENAAPTFSNLDGTPDYAENSTTPVVLDSNVTIADTELDALNGGNGNYEDASLTLSRNGGANSSDIFEATSTLNSLAEGNTITVDSTNIGTIMTNSGGTLALTFSSSATTALVNSAVQKIAYRNNSEPGECNVQIDWVFNDNNADDPKSVTGSTTVSIKRPTWNGTANWTSGGNWNTGSAPDTNTMNVIINSGTVTISANNTINNLTVNSNGLVLADGATLTVTGLTTIQTLTPFTFNNDGTVLLYNDVYDGSGNLKLDVVHFIIIKSSIIVP